LIGISLDDGSDEVSLEVVSLLSIVDVDSDSALEEEIGQLVSKNTGKNDNTAISRLFNAILGPPYKRTMSTIVFFILT
jgi:hypothetical protein